MIHFDLSTDHRPGPGAAARATRAERLTLWATVAALGAGLLAYSQTWALFWGEGFHLLAARLINAGKKPYVDFFYQHAPLYAYLSAGWMRLFGETWRSAHAFSALLSGGCIILVAGFVFSRLPDPGWRLAGTLTAALLVGLHTLTIRVGTVGHPFGLCLFLVMTSFRLAVEAVGRPTGFLAFWAGVCAGAAGASSLLTAPVAPILLLWISRHNLAGDRLGKCSWFVAGAVIPFLPLLWLAALGPRQTLFNVIEYHLFYRRLVTINASSWDLRMIAGMLDSPQAVVPILLAAVGLLFLAEPKEWEARRRAEFCLCAWLAGGLCMLAALAHPTFVWYFVVAVPFLSILAATGLYAIGLRVGALRSPGWLVLLVIGLFAAPVAKMAYHRFRHPPGFWRELEQVGQQVNAVTPENAEIMANEFVYFVARRLPPSGLENHNSPWLRLPADLAASLHVVPESYLQQALREGRYATVVTPYADHSMEESGVARMYAGRKKVGGYEISWGRAAP